jgi:hypothetical protein
MEQHGNFQSLLVSSGEYKVEARGMDAKVSSDENSCYQSILFRNFSRTNSNHETSGEVNEDENNCGDG